MAVALALGILCSEYIDISFVIVFVLALIIVSRLLVKKFKSIKLHRNWICIVFAVGCIISFVAQSYEMNGLYPVDDKFIELTGYVYTIPKKNDDRYSYIIRTEKAEYLGKEYKTDELVKMTSEQQFKYGEKLKINGFLEKLNKRKNSSDFDYRLYYKGLGICYSISDFEIESDGVRNLIGIKHLVRTMRINASEFIDRYFTGDRAALLKAVITGQKNEFGEEFKNVLIKTNTTRMLYPAYLHILIIFALISLLAVFVKKDIRDYVFLAILLLYAMFNFDRLIPVKCAFLMAITIISVRKLGYSHFPDLLSIVVIVMLMLNPLIIYKTGFVISITAGWLVFILKAPLSGRLAFIKSYTLRYFIVFTLILTIGLIPVLAYFFYGVSIYSTLLNYIFFPIIATIILLFPAFWIETLIFADGFLFKYVIDGALWCLNRLPYLVEHLPFYIIELKRPAIMEIYIFYLCMLLIRYVYYRGWNNIRTKITLAMILSGILSLGMHQFNMRDTMYMNFVNVGHGDASCIKLPKGEKIIVDGGGGSEFSNYNVGEKIFIPYLKCNGFHNIDMAIVTHYHKDHCEGIIETLKYLNVKCVVMPGCMPDNKYRIEIERLAREKGTEIQYVSKGDKIVFDRSGVTLKIIYPDEEFETDDINDTSIVFEIEYKNFKALYTGDISEDTEHLCAEEFSDIDLLKVAHHGSDSSTSQEFLDIVKPEIAVISAEEESSYGLPAKAVIKRLKANKAEIFRTDKNGDISFAVLRDGRILANILYIE